MPSNRCCILNLIEESVEGKKTPSETFNVLAIRTSKINFEGLFPLSFSLMSKLLLQ